MDLRDCQQLASWMASVAKSPSALNLNKSKEEWTPQDLLELILLISEQANVLGIELAELLEEHRLKFLQEHPALRIQADGSVVPDRIHKVTVYAASSSSVPAIYLNEAEKLGHLLAKQGWVTVFGGGSTGLMGALSRGVRAHNGQIVGVILDRFLERAVMDDEVLQMKTVSTMRSRKRGLEEEGDAFICLPGGLGTLEELFEAISFRHLAFHDKPIVFCNIQGFWDDTLRQLERCFKENFIPQISKRTYAVASTVEDAIQILKNWTRETHAFVSEAAELLGNNPQDN